jgi:anti-sigma-K factor RskA
MKDHAQYAEMLALYAIGALDDAQDCPDLETHLRSCPECRQELALLRGDAALLALSAAGPAPPQNARQRLAAAISNQPRQRTVPRGVVIGVLRPRWLTFAPIAATLLLAVFSLMLWRTNSRLQAKLDQTQAQLQERGKELQQAQAIRDLLHSPDTMQVTLIAAKKPPQPHVKTFYSPKMGRLMLVASNLERLPTNKAYELWLLPANGGAPMPCGMFSPNAKGDAMLDHSLSSSGVEAKGFAITVEPESGSAVPTPPIQMIGTG